MNELIKIFILGVLLISAGQTLAQPNNVAEMQRDDYFVSIDTVIIGCTSGAAAGIFAGSFPLVTAMLTGIGFYDSFSLLTNLAGLGCGVGAASGGVAVLTAWITAQLK